MSFLEVLLAEELYALRLRGNRIDPTTEAKTLAIGSARERRCHGGGVIGTNELGTHSSCISMALRGHSETQMPQPLQ